MAIPTCFTGTAVIAIVAAILAAGWSGSANAQAIRCEALVFTNERIACYYYRASLSPGQSCLFCAPQVQKPAKRAKPRHTKR
jgi:hypothetical protein